ncbi:phage major capsid protein [Bacillus cereus]|nr:phage major capsid protein [Bacillus cereus]
MELRVQAAKLRASTGGTMTVSGYINKTGQLSNVLGVTKRFVEKIAKGVFSRARKFRSVNGTLKVARETSIGVGAFVGEGKNITEGIISLGYVELGQKRLGAYLSLTTQLVNDAAINMDEYIPNLLAKRTFKTVEKSILQGTLSEEFKGIVPNEEIGKFTLPTTVNDEELLDKMLDMITSTHPDYLQRSAFIVSRPFFNRLAKLKDGNSHCYIKKRYCEWMSILYFSWFRINSH